MSNTTCKIIRGHVSPETAYLVNDYPYGFRLRCKIRYWLEHKAGHGTRLVSQTTNPKRQGQQIGCDAAGDYWNKPKASTYSAGFAFMFLDEQGHVQWTCLSAYSDAGKDYADFRAKWDALLTDAERADVAHKESISRKVNPTSWAEYDRAQGASRAQIAALAGCDFCFLKTPQGWRSVGNVTQEADKRPLFVSEYLARPGVQSVAFVSFCYADNPNVMTDGEIVKHSHEVHRANFTDHK
jgi:hypothetical protein